MKKYNCILIYNAEKSKILFCKRKKPPYRGLWNLIGGKIEDGETSFDAAYRELYEETGITDKDTELIYLMDMVYYQTDMKLEIFGGILNKEVTLVEEFQTLSWIDAKEDFFDCGCFAGDGNIGHIVRMMEKMTGISC